MLPGGQPSATDRKGSTFTVSTMPRLPATMTRVHVILALALLPCAFGKVISNSLFLAENAQLPGWTTTA